MPNHKQGAQKFGGGSGSHRGGRGGFARNEDENSGARHQRGVRPATGRPQGQRPGPKFENGSKQQPQRVQTARVKPANQENHVTRPIALQGKPLARDVQKQFYKEAESVRNRDAEENRQFMEENQIKAEGTNVPRPVTTFDESSLPRFLINEIKANPKFVNPSPIQAQVWPVALQGRDVFGIAQTGSGKTLAFIMPAIVHMMAQPKRRRGDGPGVLVVAPTRELACQIEVEAATFTKACRLSTLCVYGGTTKYHQEKALHAGVDILIATPGRLLDFLSTGDTNMHNVSYLVLDEADRMLDMGFERDIRKIVAETSDQRQTCMFSATWPEEIQSMARQYCHTAPIHITIGNHDNVGTLTANKDIEQNVYMLSSDLDKYDQMKSVLTKVCVAADGRPVAQKIIIFIAKKHAVDKMQKKINRDDAFNQAVRFKTMGMHGDKSQNQRDDVLRRFKLPLQNDTVILLATDVASRGLDVKDIDVVINYDMPLKIEDYVHRIGRTGRAGAKGVAYSFVTLHSDDKTTKENKNQVDVAKDLIKVLQKCDQRVPEGLLRLKGPSRSNFARAENRAQTAQPQSNGVDGRKRQNFSKDEKLTDIRPGKFAAIGGRDRWARNDRFDEKPAVENGHHNRNNGGGLTRDAMAARRTEKCEKKEVEKPQVKEQKKPRDLAAEIIKKGKQEKKAHVQEQKQGGNEKKQEGKNQKQPAFHENGGGKKNHAKEQKQGGNEKKAQPQQKQQDKKPVNENGHQNRKKQEQKQPAANEKKEGGNGGTKFVWRQKQNDN